MTKKLAVAVILLTTVLFGVALWWFQSRAYHEAIAADAFVRTDAGGAVA